MIVERLLIEHVYFLTNSANSIMFVNKVNVFGTIIYERILKKINDYSYILNQEQQINGMPEINRSMSLNGN